MKMKEIKEINKKVRDALNLNSKKFFELYKEEFNEQFSNSFHSFLQEDGKVFRKLLRFGEELDIVAYTGLSLLHPEKEEFEKVIKEYNFPTPPTTKEDLLKIHELTTTYPNMICQAFGEEFEKEFTPEEEDNENEE